MAKRLKFYDLKKKKSFMTDKYKIVIRKGRRFAVARSPGGTESWRILGQSLG